MEMLLGLIAVSIAAVIVVYVLVLAIRGLDRWAERLTDK